MKRVSRSAVVTRLQCAMKRYLQYEFRQTGISPKDFTKTDDNVIGLSALPKVRGAIFHDLSLAIIEGADAKELGELLAKKATVLPDTIRNTQSTLIRRALLGWEMIRGPWWRQHFDVISAEKEWTWQLGSDIVVPLRLDKILRRKDDGALGIFDYKTMGSVDPNWVARMEYSTQTHIYIQALRERSGEFILGICYDGVVIGKPYKGQHKSPFILGYEKNGKVSATYSSGSVPVDLTTYSDDKWLEWMQKQGKLKELYTTTGFLNPAPSLLLHTRKSVSEAESHWADTVAAIEHTRQHYGEHSPEYAYMLGNVEKNPEQCLKYGLDYACPFVRQCWQGFPIDDEFEPRKDHHGEETGED